MYNIINGDAILELEKLESESIHCCVTSPPYYGLRDYGVDGQIGLESTPEEYVEKLVAVFREVKRVLRDDGTLFLNLGDSYWGGKGSNGSSKARRTADERGYLQSDGTVMMDTRPTDGKHSIIKPKDLIGIPWRVAFALQADGWYLRSDIIWHKPNPMPESVTDRPTKSHEYIFLLSKSEKYYFDQESVRESAYNWGVRDRSNMRNGTTDPKLKHHGLSDGNFAESGRNVRTVWTVATRSYKEAHFATFPEKLIEPCIKAGCPKGGTVLDPFGGSGTTGVVAEKLGRNYILIEINPDYIKMSDSRTWNVAPLFR